MTECERMVGEGKIPVGFLEEEERSGTLVTEERKKEWAVYLDLFRAFGALCRKYNLRYWVYAGTLLGAVRHKGFIPWDDDLDVCMPREDYDRLLEINPEMETPYFFRTVYTDKDYFYSVACICNTNTTFVSVEKHNDCHRCMAISIFPLDGISRNERLQRIRFRHLKLISVIAHAYVYNINPSPAARIVNRILHLPFVPYSPQRAFERANRIARKTPWEKAEKVGVMIYTPYRYEKNIFEKGDFDRTVYLPFENAEVPAPEGYDELLRATYGNYMEFPPESQRAGAHDAFCDPDHSYLEYRGRVFERGAKAPKQIMVKR